MRNKNKNKNKMEKDVKKIKTKNEKHKKRRWDTILVGIGMATAFVIVLMKLTGYWPCEIILSLQIEQISCDKSIQENVSSIIIEGKFAPAKVVKIVPPPNLGFISIILRIPSADSFI
ncbi:MAG: hypothetical protein K0R16_2185 [Nitrososphaeraceae archaeon]|nr:hypothetical protein [Nitrososphaeraceae archaeon]